MNIIVAASENNAIGYKGQMPWHLGADLKYFKSVTMGHAIIMGRKTYESIGRPLPGRRNIIVTHNVSFHIAPEIMEKLKPGTSVEVYYDLAEAIEKAPEDAFVIGGAQIYNSLWNEADRLYITRVHTVVEKFDTSVPPVPAGYTLEASEGMSADENNDFSMTFEVWKRG